MAAQPSETVDFDDDRAEITQHAGRVYVREHVDTPEGPVEIEVRAAHSREDPSVYLDIQFWHETLQRERILDGWDGHRRDD